MGLSIKSILLKNFKNQPEIWEIDAINNVMKSEGVSGEYWKWTIRFYLMELTCGGMIVPVEQKLDNTGFFGEGHSVSKFKVTEFGLGKIESMLE